MLAEASILHLVRQPHQVPSPPVEPKTHDHLSFIKLELELHGRKKHDYIEAKVFLVS